MVENSRLTELYNLSRVISSTLEPQEVLNLIIDAAVKITKATTGSLMLIDRDSGILNIEVARGFPPRVVSDTKLKIGEGITGWVAKQGKPVLVPDVTRDKRYIKIDKDVKSELAVPLILEDEVIGVVNVDSTRASAFTQEDMELIFTLASQSAKIIQNAKLYETLKWRVEELSALFDIGKVITETLNLEKVLETIVEKASHLMNTKVSSLMLLNSGGDELVIKAVHGGGMDYNTLKPNLKVDESLIGQVVRTKKPLMILDVRKEKGYRHLDLAKKVGLCSLLSVPMMVKERIIGVINTYTAAQHRFTSEEIQLLSSLADQSAIAIENARLYEQMIGLEERIRETEKLGVLGEMAIEVAHEIRNPLTIVKMLFHSLSIPDKKDATIIENELDRMNRIVTQFLNYARGEKPEQQKMDINQVLENTLLLVEHRLSQQRMKLKKTLLPLPSISCYPEKTAQLFLNLFLNAIDAMEDGGELEVSSEAIGGFIQVKIKDSGSGIPESIKERIFQPFVTTKAKGLGLGLAIVHRVVEEHRGKIEVDSTPDIGATFTVSLPIEVVQ
ncbi:MAG: histidine kinase [Deltaproteobacteria bacterium CG_4_8_14_3_um_filter_43_13]|nr:MAG: histidine kinase [Deltaproteobacteria bacterium CG_4_8_14_3_um_filter_43_13]